MPSFCALCGAPFDYASAEVWLREFRAGNMTSTHPALHTRPWSHFTLVYTEDDRWDEVRLSGIGICDQFENRAPTDSGSRYDGQSPHPADIIDIELSRISFENFIHPNPRYDPRPFWGFGFHATCWQLMTTLFRPSLRDLFHACLSMHTSPDGLLDWGHEYGGAAQYAMSGISGSTLMLAPRFWTADPSCGLRLDPMNVPFIRHLMGTTVASDGDEDELDQVGNFCPADASQKYDPFRILPPEILQSLLTGLSSKDACILRLSSPAVASVGLSEAFWASRFSEGREYHFIFEAWSTKPKSWKALYLGIQATMHSCPNLVNRRRIWGVALLMRSLLRNLSLDSCAGHPLKCFFDATGDQDNLPWLTASRCLQGPTDSFSKGCRALRCRMVNMEPWSGISKLFVSCVRLHNGIFLSGIRFQYHSGQETCLGYINPHCETAIPLSPSSQHAPGSAAPGFHLALDDTGIKGIAVLMGDGTLSSWVGEHRNVPKWRLADDRGNSISSLKGEFDVSSAYLLASSSQTAMSIL